MMKYFVFIFLIVGLISCDKKEPAVVNNEENPDETPSTASKSGTTNLSLKNVSLDWIGTNNNNLYASDINNGNYIVRVSTTDRKVNLIKKYSSAVRFQVISDYVHSNGDIYSFAKTDQNNLGIKKMDADGNIIWAKKIKLTIGIYATPSDVTPRAIKLINGHLWALCNFMLFKINPQNGEVLLHTTIGDLGSRWTYGADIIKAGDHIMLQMGGNHLRFYILKTSDLSIVKYVVTELTINPSTGFFTNTILEAGDNRFFALTGYVLQGSLFPRAIIVEFDSDGKILNSAPMKDGLDQFEVTRVHRDKEGNYCVSYNTTIELATNIKTKDVLIFDKNLELKHKVSLPANSGGSAISFDNNMAAMLKYDWIANRLTVEWIDMQKPACKLTPMPTYIKLENLTFKTPSVTLGGTFLQHTITFNGTEDLTISTENVNITQQVTTCN
ncbi:hypothetical protein [Pedobacter glucosidilyticus]|uniref:hypothetical protein n=1 Tax=Pedobacter glucosidilyticus TaxID=1122941 RepID=UPI0026EC9EBD|nr:hypothetical protein [Pedobacter glucosidilyticus]